MLRRASPAEGALRTSALLRLLGQHHASPRGPGKRWRGGSTRMSRAPVDDDEAVDDEAAIASW
ncbi:hypothetical protein NVS55_04110 [Myxococcus stipitatus]|uniref:hypothetical protein n=1 Tax=Myxococcus stipitatus TaxID=83455 RepID=UPI0031453ED7